VTETTHEAGRPRGLFISYRRGESSGQARALRNELANHFGKGRVFMDVDSISPGSDFVEKINEAIESSGVVLVLIGRDWGGKTDHSLSDPNDFVRLEIDAALKRNVHIIPIFVERAQMPNQARLPESLRPLANRQGLDLENARWDSDVQRLIDAVAPYIDSEFVATTPSLDDGTVKQETEYKQVRRRPRSRRSIPIGIVIAVVVLVLVVFFLTRSEHKPKEPGQISAAHTVASVDPNRMAEALLSKDFTDRTLPKGLSPSGPPTLGTFRDQDVVAQIDVPLSGPDSSMGINYLVFDTPGAASHYEAGSTPAGAGFRMKGIFTSSGIGNSVKCGRSYEAASSSQNQTWSSDCLTKSANVVDFVYVGSSSKKNAANDSLATRLTEVAIRHLVSVASVTPKTALVSPPGSLSPDAQFAQALTTSYGSTFEPYGLTNPAVHSYSAGSGPPAGLVNGSYILTSFDGPDQFDEMYFYIFGTAQQAQNWFNPVPVITGATKTSASLDCSGFSQQAQCANFSLPADGSTPALGLSQCAVLWGNVVIFGDSKSRTSTQEGNGDIAVTLARAGVMYLDQLGGS
jgi:TIR domain